MKKSLLVFILCLSVLAVSCSEDPTDEEVFLQTIGSYMFIESTTGGTIITIYSASRINVNAWGLGMASSSENYNTYGNYLSETIFTFDKATSSSKGYYVSPNGEYKIEITIYTSSIRVLFLKGSEQIASASGYFLLKS